MKRFRSLMVATLGSLAVIASAQNQPDIKFTVSPGVTSPEHAVHLRSDATIGDVTLNVYTIDDNGRHPLTAWQLSGITETTYNLPTVQKDTYMAVVAETAGAEKPLFEWTTMRRPEGVSLMDYEGRNQIGPPEDFDEYWARARKELAAVPMNPRISEMPDYNTETGQLYRVELDSIADTTIVCYYMVPREVNGKLPAMIIMPGYLSTEPPIDRTPDGIITLSVNPRNHGPSKEYWKAPGVQLAYNIDDPENQYYKLAIMDCVRGMDFLVSREEVDTTRIASEGGSQGGLFSVALAALDDRVTCAVANVPAFANFSDRNYLSLRGTQIAYQKVFANESIDQKAVRRSMALMDTANFATRVRVPIQINVGGVDPGCPYLTGIVLYNRIPKGTEKEFNIFPNTGHSTPPDMRDKNAEWVQKWLPLESKPSLPGKIIKVE